MTEQTDKLIKAFIKTIDDLLDYINVIDEDPIEQIIHRVAESLSDKEDYKKFALALVKIDPVSLSHIEADRLPDGEYYNVALYAIREHNKMEGYSRDRYTIECVDLDYVTPDQYLQLALEAGPAQNVLNEVNTDRLPEGGYLKLALLFVERDGYQIKWVESPELTSEEYLSVVSVAVKKLEGTKKVLDCICEIGFHGFLFDGKKGEDAIQALQEKLNAGSKVEIPEPQGRVEKNNIEADISQYRG